MIKVETPFGIGFASDAEDLKKMVEWLKPYKKKYECYKSIIEQITGIECKDKNITEEDIDGIIQGAAISSALNGLKDKEEKNDNLLNKYLKMIENV